MKTLRSFWLCLTLILLFPVTYAGNGKKIYADYHGVRYTRLHDGKLGRWSYFAKTDKSATSTRLICYNADQVGADGRHEIAAAHYPLVGLQSDLDDDYLEYQILTAKAAGIDGFFIEWGFRPHENDVLLKAMQRVAAKYDFEIGINWCDGWLYYDWITKIYPQISDRAAKTRYMAQCYRYLLDSVLYARTAPLVNGAPVFYHFGGGARPDEFMEVQKAVRLDGGRPEPSILRRWAEWGQIVDGVYQPVTSGSDICAWKSLGETPTAWIPARVRKGDGAYPSYDYWASEEDVLRFLEPFRDSVWLAPRRPHEVKSGFVIPGMDNRGCAGWGHSVFYLIDRNDGSLYDRMWQYCMQSKDSLDMMFIASWSDFTEGHEIAPTIECGYRELETTMKYAAQFKEFVPDGKALRLPYRLFVERKNVEWLKPLIPDWQQFADSLDQVASMLAKGAYDAAEQTLVRCGQAVAAVKKRVRTRTISLDEAGMTIRGASKKKAWNATDGLTLTLGVRANIDLNTSYNRGFMEFEYLDVPDAALFVRSATRKEPKHDFETVGKIMTTGSGLWKKARITLYGENIAYPYQKPAFYLKGGTMVRNISLQYDLYTI